MPKDSFQHIPRTPVVQNISAAIDLFWQADASQRRSTPVARTGAKVGASVCQAFAHVMQQQVGVRLKTAVRQIRQRRLPSGIVTSCDT
jgi:hypothetical protein